jgi:hypothetical protein
MRVYIDGAPMNYSNGPFDFKEWNIRVDDVEAIEIYSGTGTPIEYMQGAASDCGVIAILTRK